MTKINRRNALALGATALSTPLIALATPATAKTYSPTDGTELFPGVRLITLGIRDSHIKGFKSIAMEDIVYQPKGASPLGDVMADDMVCTVTEGELQVTAGDMKFTAKEGDVWSCGKGSTKEAAANNGTVVAVMRVINLKAA
jgi:quercetin dioxygenase-like cupin family protein